MSILHQLATASTLTVEAGGLSWRVRRVVSADLLLVGMGALLVALPDDNGRVSAPPMTPQAMRDGMAMGKAAALAGVEAVSDDGGATWLPVKLVAEVRDESPDHGRLALASLPPGALDQLSAAVLRLSLPGGAARDGLTSFPGAPADPDRSAGPEVRGPTS